MSDLFISGQIRQSMRGECSVFEFYIFFNVQPVNTFFFYFFNTTLNKRIALDYNCKIETTYFDKSEINDGKTGFEVKIRIEF